MAAALRSKLSGQPAVTQNGLALLCRGLTSSAACFADKEGQQQHQDGTVDFGFQHVPREEKQNLVHQVFSSVSSSYDIMNDLMSGGMHRLWKDRLVEKLRPRPGQRHLDVAGGTGDVAFRVWDAMRAARPGSPYPGSFASTAWPAPAGSSPAGGQQQDEQLGEQQLGEQQQQQHQQVPPVTVCDINASMLAEGRRRAEARGVGPEGIAWVEGNAEALPFADATFDSYTVAFGIRNVTDRPAALREALRVLRPGGRLLCLEFSKVVVPGMQQLYDLYSFNVIPQIGRAVANDAESYQYLVESIRMFPGQEEWAGMIEQAGFRGVDYENLTFGVVAIHSGFKLA